MKVPSTTNQGASHVDALMQRRETVISPQAALAAEKESHITLN